jgi:hypothetical protein
MDMEAACQSPNIQKRLSHDNPSLDAEAAELHDHLEAEEYLLLNVEPQIRRPEDASEPPIRRLPTEILQDIFVWCQASHHLTDIDTDFVTILRMIRDMGHGIPWVLTRVCSRWRRIVTMSLPGLWSRVIVECQHARKHFGFMNLLGRPVSF